MPTVSDNIIINNIEVSGVKPAYIDITLRFDIYRVAYEGVGNTDPDPFPNSGSNTNTNSDPPPDFFLKRISEDAYHVSVDTYLEGDTSGGNFGWVEIFTTTPDEYSIDLGGEGGDIAVPVGHVYNFINYEIYIPATDFPDNWTGKIKLVPEVFTGNSWPSETPLGKSVIGIGLSLTGGNSTPTADLNNDSGHNANNNVVDVDAYTSKSIITGTDVLIGEPISGKTTSSYNAFTNGTLITPTDPNQPPTIEPLNDIDMIPNSSRTLDYTVNDPDDSNSNLNVTASSSNQANVSVSVDSNDPEFTVTTGSSTTNATITLTVEDLDGATDQESFDVTVEPVPN